MTRDPADPRRPGHCLCGWPADDQETQTCRPCRDDRHMGVLEDEREERGDHRG